MPGDGGQKHVRYDISKLRYFDISKTSIRLSKLRYFDISKISIRYLTPACTLLPHCREIQLGNSFPRAPGFSTRIYQVAVTCWYIFYITGYRTIVYNINTRMARIISNPLLHCKTFFGTHYLELVQIFILSCSKGSSIKFRN